MTRRWRWQGMWRIEGNNVMKRMGELRSDKEAAKGGVWPVTTGVS